jgi:hypothetical protein
MTTNALPSAAPIATLIELLERQCQLYSQLSELSARQSQMIKSDLVGRADAATGACDQLLRLLAQRQALIDQITTVDRRLEPYRADWAQLWQGLSPQDRCRIGPLVKQIDYTLARMIEQDKLDQQRLEKARSGTASELTRLAAAGAAANAYKIAPGQDQLNRFTNQQG